MVETHCAPFPGQAAGDHHRYHGQLRRKLEIDPARPKHLITEPGIGYRFQPG